MNSNESKKGGYPESEIQFDSSTNYPTHSWMVRPCEWYREEYKDCKSIGARFHQYYIHGHTIECTDWKESYDRCLNFRKTGNIESLEKVIQFELSRRNERESASRANNVWEYRVSPPTDWNKPLPEWFNEQNKLSYLRAWMDKKNRKKQEQDKAKSN